MLDIANFRPCPKRPNHWIEVKIVPAETVHHREGGELRLVVPVDPDTGLSLPARVEAAPVQVVETVIPAQEKPTGVEIACRQDQLAAMIDELNEAENG